MNQADLEKMIRDILVQENQVTGAPAAGTVTDAGASAGTRVTYMDYPLGERSADKLRTPTGKSIQDVTLAAVMRGEIVGADVRITPETLEMQAQVAESRGRNLLAANLRRASELIAVPDERILEIYNAMRPYRSTKKELYDIAEELERKYGAKVTAGLVRESADVGEARGRLRQD